jgi:hypothetical protein
MGVTYRTHKQKQKCGQRMLTSVEVLVLFFFFFFSSTAAGSSTEVVAGSAAEVALADRTESATGATDAGFSIAK